jgi:hypothetical protein
MASRGFRGGDFHNGFYHDRGYRGYGGYGFYGPYDYGYGYGYGYPDYAYDYGYPDYAYGDSYYGNGDCHVVQRRVHSHSGWHVRPVQVCG